MTDFTQLGLPEALVEVLKRMQITVPTPVQAATIPIALSGSDILASAQTGTGKTIAYLIPLIMKLMENPQENALILTPTRELATQVHQTLSKILGKTFSFKTALLIGGAPMFRQISDLKKRPQFIVGTPGRITDHLVSRNFTLKDARYLIIDEADRMLDMGFGIQIDKIATFLPEERQTLMFSATVPPNIEKLSKKHMRDPQRISMNSTTLPAPLIKQEIKRISVSEKFQELLQQLEAREGSIIVFVKTKRGAESLSRELQVHGHSTNAIHGDLPQRRRERVIQAFRSQKSRVMVATDVAARGLDIPHIMHVINYDLPQCPEDYIHRIGRTGRAGAEGNSLCLVSPEDNQKWKAISRLMDPQTKHSGDSEPEERERRPFKPNRKKRFFKRDEKRGERRHFQKRKRNNDNFFA